MKLIWIVAFAILSVLGAVLSRQMTDEFKAWLPWLIQRVIDRAVCTLPKDRRERFAEEWRGHIDEIPGDASKLIVALGFLVASSKMPGVPSAAAQRLFDVALSTTLIAFLTPFLLFVAVSIKLDAPGPVLFRQVRIGRDGKRFYIYKFRTMLLPNSHADGYGVTRIGKWLRTLRLDETPQLINVLIGDMSLVGPPPLLPDHDTPSVLHESDLKPGILFGNDPANGTTESRREKRYEEELDFLNNRSLFLYFKILGRAVWRILTGRFEP